MRTNNPVKPAAKLSYQIPMKEDIQVANNIQKDAPKHMSSGKCKLSQL